VYRERVCVRGKVPLLIVGSAVDAAATVIVDGKYNALRKVAGQPGHPCGGDEKNDTFGTAGSASMAVQSDDVVIAHLTIENDAMNHVRDGQNYPAGVGESGGAQAVALMTAGDRIVLDQVRLLGHQDTLYAARRHMGRVARVLVRRSLIAGDVDFIFGDAQLVIEQCTVLSRAHRRKPQSGGHVLAPSTAAHVRHGFLVTHSVFAAEPGVSAASISLGRAWDHGVAHGQWQPATAAHPSPNGQALIRNSILGPHLKPWSNSTSRRPFSSEGEAANRMAEFNNHEQLP
jgi:pectin methylesterase-like acyl-CoA thioesterase